MEKTIQIITKDQLTQAIKEELAPIVDAFNRKNSIVDLVTLTPDEVKEILQLKTPTYKKYCSNGTLNPIRISGLIRFRKSDIEAMLETEVD